MSKAIPKLDQEIITKLQSGMSPAQISIEYEKNGEDVSASHCRWIKLILESGCTELLEQEQDVQNHFFRNSRDYSASKE